MTPVFRKIKSFRQFLKECLAEVKSVMGYDSWGLIDPSGKVIEGDDDDKEIKDYGGSHEGLILKLKMADYDEMYRKGYVRWIVNKAFGKTGASFSFQSRMNEQKILKAYERIKDFLAEKRHEITGAVYVECDDPTFDIMADSILEALRTLNSTIEKIRQGKEDQITEPEFDAHQMAMMKKFKAMHHK
jgi:hypothetical protein